MNTIYISKAGRVAPEQYWREWAINLFSEGGDIVPTPLDWWLRTVRVLGLTLVEDNKNDN